VTRVGVSLGAGLLCASLLLLGATPCGAQGQDPKREGVIAFNLQDYALAEKYLLDARKANPNDAEVCDYLAKTYEKLDDADAARAMRDEAARLRRGARPPGSAPPARPPSETPALGPVREKWALVVGIGKFKDANLVGLAFSSKDAGDVAAALVDAGAGRFRRDHVRLLQDEDATRANVKEGIKFIAERARPDDLVVIYLASHGAPPSVDMTGDGYLITYDADPDRLFGTAIPMKELREDVKQFVAARRKVVFLDTCYSGRAVEGSRDLRLPGKVQTDAARDLSGDGFVVITSSDASEQSYESKKLGNGYFTRVLVEALRAREGRLTVREIFTRLRDEVPVHVERDMRRRQNPRMFESGSGTAGEILIGAQAFR
jgi:hypothetical protein